MSSIPRSNRPEVRNPILAMPEVLAEIEKLDPEARAALGKMLKAMSKVFAIKAQQDWAQSKAPGAYYRKVSSIYARHMSLALRKANEVAPSVDSTGLAKA